MSDTATRATMDDDLFGFDVDSGSMALLEREAKATMHSPQSGYLRSFAARWLAPLAVIAGIALAGQSVFRLDAMFGAQNVASASVGGLRGAFPALFQDTMPTDLVAYDESQYRNFSQGIARFSNADLLEYAATTARDLRGIEDPMTPFLLDVLLLTHREIDRRGLTRPVTTAALDAQRESLRARQTNL